MSTYKWMATLMTSSVIRKIPLIPNEKMAFPKAMVVDTVKWFDQVMGRPGEKRLQETLNQCYYHPRLRYHIDKLKCKDCQKHKLEGRGYGLLPKWEVQIAPWEEVSINLIGPWEAKVNGQQVEFYALTCIDTALRQPNIYVTSSCKVGFVNILVLYNAYMTKWIQQTRFSMAIGNL